MGIIKPIPFQSKASALGEVGATMPAKLSLKRRCTIKIHTLNTFEGNPDRNSVISLAG